VVGLGLLAGAGAIVDYWPVGGPLPAVSSARAALTPALSATLPAPASSIPAPVVHVAFRRPITPVVVTVAPVVGQPVEWPELPAAPAEAPMVDAVTAISFEPVRVDSAPPASLGMIELVDLGPMPTMASGDALDDAERILAGAIRRTRESLKGARWFLGDKLQGMVGAVRKVSPFWDSSAPQLH
jgi:hypothetical protein